MIQHLRDYLGFLPSLYTVPGMIFWSFLIYVLSITVPIIVAPVLADITKDMKLR